MLSSSNSLHKYYSRCNLVNLKTALLFLPPIDPIRFIAHLSVGVGSLQDWIEGGTLRDLQPYQRGIMIKTEKRAGEEEEITTGIIMPDI